MTNNILKLTSLYILKLSEFFEVKIWSLIAQFMGLFEVVNSNKSLNINTTRSLLDFTLFRRPQWRNWRFPKQLVSEFNFSTCFDQILCLELEKFQNNMKLRLVYKNIFKKVHFAWLKCYIHVYKLYFTY